MFKHARSFFSLLAHVVRRNRGRMARRCRPFVYFDIGLHRDARQLQIVLNWFGNDVLAYGFEANPDYFADCARQFGSDPRLTLINTAVVGPDHIGDTVTLHLDGKKGLGDSLFPQRGDGRSVEVPAVKLSDFIQRQGIDPTTPIILRMNIEGGELFVLRDLAQAELISRVSGWYGRWDDCAKISYEMDAELRQLVAENKIDHLSFNDRDSRGLYGRINEALIRYDMTCVTSETPRRPLH